MTRAALRAAAQRILRAGLAAVEPGRLVRGQIRVTSEGTLVGGARVTRAGRVFVVAVGKAAVPMMQAAIEALGTRITAGLLVSPNHAPAFPRTRNYVSGHPVPDAAGLRAGRAVIALLESARREDLILLLLSGGASALLPAPVGGVRLQDKQAITRLLLRRGATIAELNAVRKRLSVLKGGGFARLAAPARVVTLALSDVPGDDPGTIGSGPTVFDRAAPRRAREALRKFLREDEVPPAVFKAILAKAPRRASGRARTRIIGSGSTFARAAALKARQLGFHVRVRRGALSGEARACGPRLVRTFMRGSTPALRCVVATGETVVHVRGRGRGGRNQELALASVEALATSPRPVVLAAFATDGVDGRSSSAGALVDDRTARLALRAEIDIAATLDANDSESALEALGALIRTGPTGTNVADVALLVG